MSRDSVHDRSAAGGDPPGEGAQADESVELPRQVSEVAAHAAELLGLGKFVHDYLDTIYLRLEEFDRSAQAPGFDDDQMFLKEGLPLAHGVIHVGSRRDALADSRRWVAAEWKEHPDPDLVLTTLILIHLTERVWEAYRDSVARRRQTQRILGRVCRISRAFSGPPG